MKRPCCFQPGAEAILGELSLSSSFNGITQPSALSCTLLTIYHYFSQSIYVNTWICFLLHMNSFKSNDIVDSCSISSSQNNNSVVWIMIPDQIIPYRYLTSPALWPFTDGTEELIIFFCLTSSVSDVTAVSLWSLIQKSLLVANEAVHEPCTNLEMLQVIAVVYRIYKINSFILITDGLFYNLIYNWT